MIQVKICGLCRPEDAAFAEESGAAYGGVILAENFRRTQPLAMARQIFAAAPRLRRIGVFVDNAPASVLHYARELSLHAVQLHGSESVEDVRTISAETKVWKAVRVRTSSDVRRALDLYAPFVSALLLDGYDPAQAGGSGTSFAWDAIAPMRAEWPAATAFVLAGGLTPENVARAVTVLAPDIVDVSSGVEEVVGKKSAERVAAFLAAARGALTAERA